MQGSKQSSLAIWTPFDATTTATIRRTLGLCYIAWTRVSNVSAFAMVGSSLVGGTDIVAGSDQTSINNADVFDYFDETEKVIRIEYDRSLIEPLGGMTMAQADVVLDNTDLRFTPDHNATIGTALKPNRPLKIFIGFQVQGQDVVIPIIEGLTLSVQENKMNRTVRISAFDYLRWLNEKPQETTIYQSQRSDQIIADILSRAGVGSSSYELDQGLNTIGFAWFEKGETAGQRIKRICEAEEAIFYQDETGKLRFENRDKYAEIPYNAAVWTIDPDDIVNWEASPQSKIINRAIISGKPRSVKEEAEVWRDGIIEEIPAGQTLTIWANFQDPVSSLTTPVENTDFEANTVSDGTGTDVSSSISIVMTAFTKSAKLEITNASGATAYVTLLKLRGTPATIDYEISEVFQDTLSIADYNENQTTIDNEFIDSRSFAASMAQNLVRRHKNPRSVVRIVVRGIPQLQLRDYVRVKDQDLNTYKNYRVMRIQGVLEGGGFIQTLTLREITSNETL